MTRPQKIPLAGVIGAPVAHSRSPNLYRHWLRSNGIAGHYVPLHIDRADLQSALSILPKLGFMGVNVTIPHKEAVLRLADLATDRARRIGAANTLVFNADGHIHADNTDGYGFVRNLRQEVPGWVPETGPAAVFGAGGAARAIIAALLGAGVPEIRLANRTRARADNLCAQFGPKVQVFDWVQAGNMVRDAATVVNASALGMAGKAPFQVPLDTLSPDAVASDLVYTPLETDFLCRARQAGCTTVDGLGMLLHQAVPGFERWFGICPAVDAAARQAVLDG